MASMFLWACCYCCCSVARSCLTLCDPMDCSTAGFPVLHHLPELAQTRVHWVGDAIQPPHPLPFPSPPTFSLSHHQGLLQWEYAKLCGRGNGGYRWKVATQLILRWRLPWVSWVGPVSSQRFLYMKEGGRVVIARVRRGDVMTEARIREMAAVCEGLRHAAVLLALMVEEGFTSYRKWVDSETGKDQEASPSRVSRRNAGVSQSTPRSQPSEI